MESVCRTASEPALIPLLLGKRGCNITFVLDVSDSMQPILGPLKGLLIQTLLRKASLRDSLFNLIIFSNKVTCLSPHMLSCAPHTVYKALSWIHSISCCPGRDLLSALKAAFSDPACDVIHLMCCDLPEQPGVTPCSALPAFTAAKPVTLFYLQESNTLLRNQTRDYLQCLTQVPGGSCQLVFYDQSGAFKKVIPLNVSESSSPTPTVECHYPPSYVSAPHPRPPSIRCTMGNVFCQHSFRDNLGCPTFFPGCRVLARRQLDGLYSVGTVVQPVQDCRDVWLVRFDHPAGAGLGPVPFQHQMVCSLDMINDRRAHAHSLEAGDAVLSPWEPGLGKYGPGRVVAAAKGRDVWSAESTRCLQVLMWNGSLTLVPPSLILPISPSHYERIVRELQSSPPAPSLTPGCYHSLCSPFAPRRCCTDCGPCAPPSCCSSVFNPPPGGAPPSCEAMFEGMDGFDGTLRDGLVDGDTVRSNPEALSSSSSLMDDGTKRSDSNRVKTPRRQQRPPWRYWRRTGPEPQHKKPGSPSPQRTPQPVRFILPIPKISSTPNTSSLFLSLPPVRGQKAHIGDVFGTVEFKPQYSLALLTGPQQVRENT